MAILVKKHEKSDTQFSGFLQFCFIFLLFTKYFLTDFSSNFNSFLKEKIINSWILLKGTDKKGTYAGSYQCTYLSNLKENVNILPGFFSHIINLTFKEGICLECFKILLVTLFNKENDTHLCSNHRLISLSPVFSKLFEKAMYNKVCSLLCRFRLVI